MKLFETIFKYFNKAEEENERRWEEFFKLREYLVDNLPKNVRELLAKERLNPTTDKDYGSFDFSIADLLWWKSKKESAPAIMKDPKEFRNEVMMSLVRVMDLYNKADSKEMEKTCRMLLSEYKEYSDEI
jgi:hypothetical protein